MTYLSTLAHMKILWVRKLWSNKRLFSGNTNTRPTVYLLNWYSGTIRNKSIMASIRKQNNHRSLVQCLICRLGTLNSCRHCYHYNCVQGLSLGQILYIQVSAYKVWDTPTNSLMSRIRELWLRGELSDMTLWLFYCFLTTCLLFMIYLWVWSSQKRAKKHEIPRTLWFKRDNQLRRWSRWFFQKDSLYTDEERIGETP